MTNRIKAFGHALHNPNCREQVLIGYLLVVMCIAAVCQTPQIIEPFVALGIPTNLAFILVIVLGAPLLSWPFRNLRRLHLKLRGKTLMTDEGYEGMERLGRRLAFAAGVGWTYLKQNGVHVLGLVSMLLAAWLAN